MVDSYRQRESGWQLQTERKRLTVTDREKAVDSYRQRESGWQLQTERKRLTVTDREKASWQLQTERKRCSYRCSVVCLLWNCLRMAVGPQRSLTQKGVCVFVCAQPWTGVCLSVCVLACWSERVNVCVYSCTYWYCWIQTAGVCCQQWSHC